MTIKIIVQEIIGKHSLHGEFIFKNWKGGIPRKGDAVTLNQHRVNFTVRVYDCIWRMDDKEVWIYAE